MMLKKLLLNYLLNPLSICMMKVKWFLINYYQKEILMNFWTKLDFLMILTADNTSYQREDNIYVVPITLLED